MPRRWLVPLLALGLLAAGCGSTRPGSAASRADATVGVVVPETGPVPQFYTDIKRGIQLATPLVDKKYGIHLAFVYADSAATPDGASRAVQQLLNTDNVDAVMGPQLSGGALQVADVMARSHRVWLLPSASSPTLVPTTGGGPNWAFRTQWSATDLDDVIARLVFADIDGHKPTVGVAYSDDAYGQTAIAQFQKFGRQYGVRVVGESMQTGATDFTAGIKRLQAAGVSSIYLNFTSGADIATVTRAMAVVGFDPPRQTTTANILANYRQLAKPAEWKDLRFVDREDHTGRAFEKVMSLYKTKYGEEPELPTLVYNVFSALDAYGQAVKKGGSDRAAVRDAMESLKSVDVEGATYMKPFGPGDGEFYDHDISKWRVMGFDSTPEGNVVTLGTVAKCIRSVC